MNYSLIKDKKFALIIWNTEQEGDVRVVVGEIVERDAKYLFINTEEDWTFTIEKAKFEEIKEVPENLNEALFDADFCLNLYMTSLPKDSKEGYTKTGMNWNEV